jgi:peptidoglycan LD-endopeptidase CwlK
MSRDKKELHNELVRAFESSCAKFTNYYPHLPVPFITCTRRTNEEQNQLYAIGRTLPGKIVTNARAGQSPHNYTISFAFDIAFLNTANKKGGLDWSPHLFKKFADIITSDFPTVEWGGNWKFKDAPHFQLKAWETLKGSLV